MDRLKFAIKELYFWQYNNGGTNFHAMLYTLIQKADLENKRRLALGFPEEVEALEMWEQAGDYGNDLFREYGLMNDSEQFHKAMVNKQTEEDGTGE